MNRSPFTAAGAALFPQAPAVMPTRSVRTTAPTRERILAAALSLIEQEGYQGFSVNAVIRKGGFSKGSFFFHFVNADALCRACLELTRARLLPSADAVRSPDLRSFLVGFGAPGPRADQLRRYLAILAFFTQLAAQNPLFADAPRELIGPFEESMVRELRRLVGPGPDEQLIGDVIVYLCVVFNGLAGKGALPADSDRDARLWSLAVATATHALASVAKSRAHPGPAANRPSQATSR